MKRKIVAVVLASTMVFGMTACGSSGASDSSSTGSDAATDDTATDDGSEDANVTEGSSDDENTLTVWTWDPNFNIYAIEKAAEIYAKDHPGFKVDVSEIKSDDIETRLTTAVSAGDLSTLPDIFLMQDNSFQKYATNYPDVFTDLTDSGIDFSQFSSAKVAYSTLEGKNYGIPFDNGAVIECLRTDMLEEAGYTRYSHASMQASHKPTIGQNVITLVTIITSQNVLTISSKNTPQIIPASVGTDTTTAVIRIIRTALNRFKSHQTKAL